MVMYLPRSPHHHVLPLFQPIDYRVNLLNNSYPLTLVFFVGNRVAVVGGSHGGFLSAHLIGQHPDLFKVACMRNPVTDIPGMLSSTDILDWCYVEGQI